jgi:2-methylisocitrate lyase-like PEP mutase family enzyme
MYNKQAEQLHEMMFHRPGISRLVGAHNALEAKLAERAGFDGIWSSGLEISTSLCGAGCKHPVYQQKLEVRGR